MPGGRSQMVAFAAAVCCLVPGPLPVHAATFAVDACDDAQGAVNNSWVAVSSAAFGSVEAVQACPSSAPDPNGTVAQGLAVQDVLNGANAAPDGGYREWRFATAPDTSISAVTLRRDIGNRSSLQSGAYTPYGRADAADLAGETCFAPSGQPYCRIAGEATFALAAQQLAWGVRCVNTTFCDGGATLHEVWVDILGATVTISDTVAPTATAPGGALAGSADWQRGDREVTLAGADSTGIRKLQLLANGSPVITFDAPASASGGCRTLNSGVAYTYAAPCAGSRGLNGSQSRTVDTGLLPNGTVTLATRAHDTAGNTADSSGVEVRIDNESPLVPSPATPATWGTAATATWTWTVPEEVDRAPVEAIEVERCTGGTCVTETLGGAAFGAQVSYEHALPEGETSVRARHVDAAGNVSAWSAASSARRDRTGPRVAIETPGSPAASGAALDPAAGASDDLSGLADLRREYRVDGGAWAAMSGPVSVAGPATVRFRAIATDAAGNVASAESGDVSVAAAVTTDPSPQATAEPSPMAPVTLEPRPALTIRRARRAHHGRVRVSGLATGAPPGTPVLLRLAVLQRSGTRHVRQLERRVRSGRFSFRLRVRRLATRRVTLRYGMTSATVTLKRAAR